jgi:hypothetical protein
MSEREAEVVAEHLTLRGVFGVRIDFEFSMQTLWRKAIALQRASPSY